MTSRTRALIAAEDLRARLGSPTLRLLEVRSGPDRRARYDAGHLQSAQYVDLEVDLAGEHHDASKGGRHPLPSIEAFGATLGRLGITASDEVVIYDDADGALAAARAWWMLKSAGHSRVAVLDGGLRAAIEAGIPVSTDSPTIAAAAPYPITGWQRATVPMDEVETLRSRADWLLIDVRSEARYRGDHEPIDPVAGHIEGAVNVPYTLNLDERGRFASSEALRAEYLARFEGRDPAHVIVSCGSGVTACHTLLALEHAGIEGARLYVGSWGEWCRTHPVES